MTSTVHPFNEHLDLDGTQCVGLWLQGLLGDAILASTYFEAILQANPGKRWIIVHSYKDQAKAGVVADLLQPFFDNGLIHRYIYHYLPSCLPLPAEVSRLFARLKVARVVELMFDRFDKSKVSAPHLGLNLVKPRRHKAVLFRQSGWNSHFPERNRPYGEWKQIEAAVLASGYESYLAGLEDTMDLTPGVTDLRKAMSVRELLDFTTDASLVVSCTTFLPVFTQFVCRTLVICDPRDQDNQRRNWKLTDHYAVHPAAAGYLPSLLDSI